MSGNSHLSAVMSGSGARSRKLYGGFRHSAAETGIGKPIPKWPFLSPLTGEMRRLGSLLP